MTWIIFKFCIGLVVLLFSTQRLVVLAEKVSRIIKISPLIVGITIVAIGTSIPELTVSLISILKHDPGLAMGNIVGSNIVNILMVLPVGILIGKLRIGTTKTQKNAFILLGATIIFFLVQFINTVKTITGSILIGLSILISYIEYEFGILGRTHEDQNRFTKTTKENICSNPLIWGIFLILGIIIGGILVVDSVEVISTITGISTTVLGLTLTAVATSLPELLTTIYSQKDHQEKITVGNIIGSNIYNLLLIGGILTLFSSNNMIQIKEWIWLGIATLGFVAILKYYKGKKPPRIIGLILLVIFFVYIFTQ